MSAAEKLSSFDAISATDRTTHDTRDGDGDKSPLVLALSRLTADWIEFALHRRAMSHNQKRRDNTDHVAPSGADGSGGSNALIRYVPSPEARERNRVRCLICDAIRLGIAAKEAASAEVQANSYSTDVAALPDAREYASQIEATLFATYFYEFEALYYTKARSLCENLERNAPHLLAHFDAPLLCYFPSEALASGTALDQWRAKHRHMLSQKMATQRKQNKGIFECPKCHLNNTDYFSLQTRGADEPETIFVECFNCNKHFKR